MGRQNDSWNRIHMEGIMIITVLLAVLLCLAVGCGIYQNRKTYRQIDGLLDLVLSREKIEYSDVKEGEFSALGTKVKRIQEVLGTQAYRVEEEKEFPYLKESRNMESCRRWGSVKRESEAHCS